MSGLKNPKQISQNEPEEKGFYWPFSNLGKTRAWVMYNPFSLILKYPLISRIHRLIPKRARIFSICIRQVYNWSMFRIN